MTIAHRLRCALVDNPATSAELTLILCDIAAPAQVRAALATEYLGGRVRRTGSVRKYVYELTDLGRRAADNPNILRAASRRRTRYHRAIAPQTAAGG